MTTAQTYAAFRRAVAKRGPSSDGWRWVKKPTALELWAWKALR